MKDEEWLAHLRWCGRGKYIIMRNIGLVSLPFEEKVINLHPQYIIKLNYQL